MNYVIKVRGSPEKSGRCFCGHRPNRNEPYYIVTHGDNMYAMCEKCVPPNPKIDMFLSSAMVTERLTMRGTSPYLIKKGDIESDRKTLQI